jgi:OmpA-OmpF porin, OOP family
MQSSFVSQSGVLATHQRLSERALSRLSAADCRLAFHGPLPALVRSFVCLMAVAGGLAFASQGRAQQVNGSFNLQTFNAPAGPRNFITTRGARTDGEHAFSFGLVTDYANRPFVVASTDEDRDEIMIVENLLTFNLLASYTPIPRLQFGLRVPVAYSAGQGITEDGQPDFDKPIRALGVADPELEAKFRLTSDPEAVFVPAIAGFVMAPLGQATAKEGFIGHKSVAGGGRLIADVAAGPLLAGLNVGYRFQSSGTIGESEVGSGVIYGGALGVAASPVVALIADVFGGSSLSGDAGTTPAELDFMARVTPLNSGLAIQGGGGLGLTQGAVGVPDYRVFVGFRYSQVDTDQDDDGVKDPDDQCPTEAEDLDGYEDGDGCPEFDNDNDAIEDAVDKCPNQPEDIDRFEDTDGCPDPDNDKDGIPDVSDRCVDEAEVVNGFEDEDGCPDVPDTDADGVVDPKDKCPNEPEDTDGFEDTDGCPDPDNDGDGIPDSRDECVDEAEDMDGEEDEDGCPEED